MDLNRLLRQCFGEREFVRDDLRQKIDAQVGQLEDYMQ